MMGIGFIVLIVVAVYFGYKYFENSSTGSYGNKSSAMETLNERYAKGEISEEEYQKMKKNLLG